MAQSRSTVSVLLKGQQGEGRYLRVAWDALMAISLARAAFEIEFFGKGAHAGVSSRASSVANIQAAPWMGINALDAAVQGCERQLSPT
jgi:metal-dependent amidase/aminoacylase/carboxypeptidase family protein